MSIYSDRNCIFLDIDGVLCTPRSSCAVGDKGIMMYLDPIGLRLLDKIVKEHDALVVISSTWRQGRDYGDFNEIFKLTGVCSLAHAMPYHDTEQHWCTPTINTPGSIRGNEIKAWLDTYGAKNYVILDDDSDMLAEQMEHFVKTDCYDGIGYRDYRKCLHILKGNLGSTFKI